MNYSYWSGVRKGTRLASYWPGSGRIHSWLIQQYKHNKLGYSSQGRWWYIFSPTLSVLRRFVVSGCCKYKLQSHVSHNNVSNNGTSVSIQHRLINTLSLYAFCIPVARLSSSHNSVHSWQNKLHLTSTHLASKQDPYLDMCSTQLCDAFSFAME